MLSNYAVRRNVVGAPAARRLGTLFCMLAHFSLKFCLSAGTAMLCALLILLPATAVETWEKLDKRLKQQVYQLNVGLKIKLRDGSRAYLCDLSPRYHYPVFSTSREDRGFFVVGFGSSFPVKTSQSDKTYFLTSRHVVETAEQISRECERFYAAMRLYAEQNASGKDVETRYKELLQTVNLATKKDLSPAERGLYTTTVDAIWDGYENFLSKRADPGRMLFERYLNQVGIEKEIGYFLHAPGPVSQSPLEAKQYKIGHTESEPDLALLTVPSVHLTGIEIDTVPAAEGQEIQVIGYPTASDQIDADSNKYYAPTFNTGRISRVAPRVLQVDAPITTGNSGGPVVSQRGKVLGVVALRAISPRGGELPNFGGAVTIHSVRAFAPELFGK